MRVTTTRDADACDNNTRDIDARDNDYTRITMHARVTTRSETFDNTRDNE